MNHQNAPQSEITEITDLSNKALKKLITWAIAAVLFNNPSISYAAPKDFIEQFIAKENRRTIVVSGNSLGNIHNIAANHFVNYLEKDFKDPKKYYAVRNFFTTVKKTKTGYEMTYSLDLIPVNKNQKHFRVVDMRWSVMDWIRSKQTVKNINHSKIPNWQKSMSNDYIWMQYLQTISQSWSIYHEAIIWFGENKK